MDQVTMRDLVDVTAGAIASAYTHATAGGAGDNTAVVGLTIDRNSYGVPLSGVFAIAYEAALGQGNTLTIKNAKIEHSQDGATWADYHAFTDPGVVDTGGAGGTTQRGVLRLGCDLKSAYRYVRFDWTPDLSAANTDTVSAIASATLAGFDRLVPPTTAV
jgi:hypothetical protein